MAEGPADDTVLHLELNSEANTRRIAIVEQCFGSSGQPLAVQGRVLVGEGVLTKMCRKKPKPRQFFLCNDILIYGNIVISKKKYNCQRIIPLEEVKLESLEDDAQYKNGWLVRTRTKSFAVYAATAAEKAEWMAHINKCVDDLLKKSGKLGATDHAAVWVPDTEAGSCMHCKKSQFTIINRRHHCRKCGKVVCGPCSNKKWILPSQSSKPLRVCLTCYDELSRAKADDNRLAGDTRDIRAPTHQNSVDSSSEDSEDEFSNGNNPPAVGGGPPDEPNVTQFYRKSTTDGGDGPPSELPPATEATN
ncbi:pleckstrin homology domain-containing family F member 2-like isoform X1 [Amphibalanus amphitrite]|uniref:pleckstrin homology domain-containing family F member 2-like isoform X1 n=1 Tax=Amphibalanus amphitrite TaxID=1232801 RepID=UPI001C926004|nr:pleckstrin homology domain-containing family F member 2-like isoform X1 [Amphibalanus amphitrite]